MTQKLVVFLIPMKSCLEKNDNDVKPNAVIKPDNKADMKDVGNMQENKDRCDRQQTTWKKGSERSRSEDKALALKVLDLVIYFLIDDISSLLRRGIVLFFFLLV